MNGPVRVLLIGFGLAGRFFHAPLLMRTPRLVLAGVVTSSAERAGAVPNGVPVFESTAMALRQGGLDLAVVAAPTGLHAIIAAEALRAGLDVVVDKPFTSTLAEAEALAALAARQGRMLTVFQNRRWDADFLEVGRLIRAGRLGRVAQFESRYDRFRPDVADRWREKAAPGAGLLFDLGSHLLDQALCLFGKPVAIRADLAVQRPGGSADDWFQVVLRYADDMRVILQGGSLLPEHSLRFAVHGTGGSYIKHGLDTQAASMRAGQGPGDPGWGHDPVPGLLTTAGGQSQEWPSSSPGSYETFYAGVRDTILLRAPPPVALEDSLSCMALLDTALVSARTRREIPTI